MSGDHLESWEAFSGRGLMQGEEVTRSQFRSGRQDSLGHSHSLSRVANQGFNAQVSMERCGLLKYCLYKEAFGDTEGATPLVCSHHPFL